MSRRKCFFRCKGKESLFGFPKEESARQLWIESLFSGQQLPSVNVLVCSRHFTEDSFLNRAQYEAGFSARLLLKEGAVPSVKQRVEESRVQAGTSGTIGPVLPEVKHVASQTDPPEIKPRFQEKRTRSVSTQLSMKTLQNSIRSKATQARVTSRDCGVCTLTFPLDSPILYLQPTLVKRPPKRPRLNIKQEQEGPSACSLSMVVHEPEDST